MIYIIASDNLWPVNTYSGRTLVGWGFWKQPFKMFFHNFST